MLAVRQLLTAKHFLLRTSTLAVVSTCEVRFALQCVRRYRTLQLKAGAFPIYFANYFSFFLITSHILYNYAKNQMYMHKKYTFTIFRALTCKRGE